MKSRLTFVVLVLFLLSLGGCKIKYTLSGASVGDAKTVTVNYFRNIASLVYPSLSQDFTDKLRDKFINDTDLVLVQDDGDLDFEGEITRYTNAPQAVTSQEQAATFRLTISIRVSYSNKLLKDYEFDKTFTRYRDYSENFSAVEAGLVEEIVEEIVDDVFRTSVVNW